MREILQSLVDRANRKIAEDERLKKHLSGISRLVCIRFTDDGSYHFRVEGGTVSDVAEGDADGDIVVEISTDLFRRIIEGEEDALAAYLGRRFRVKASLADKMLFAEILRG